MKVFIKISVIILFLFSNCSTKEKVPPAIPSENNIDFNFSYFEQIKADNLNFSLAAEKAIAWKSILKDSVIVQYSSLNEAKNYSFEHQSENTWLIDFLLNLDNNNYNIKLFGIIEADTVRYKTFMTFGQDTNKVIIDGHTYNNNKSGEWILNKPGYQDTVYTYIKFLTINREIDSLNKEKIKFTDNQPGDSHLNHLLYKDSIDNIYDSYLDIYNKGEENHSIIEWNKSTKQGRIQDKLKFGNIQWYCWDENLQDIDCN